MSQLSTWRSTGRWWLPVDAGVVETGAAGLVAGLEVHLHRRCTGRSVGGDLERLPRAGGVGVVGLVLAEVVPGVVEPRECDALAAGRGDAVDVGAHRERLAGGQDRQLLQD